MDSNKIIENKFVVLTYEIYDEKSEVIEKVDIPMNYIHGKGKKLLQKIEDSLEGKVAGEEIEVLIKPEDGFGEYDDSLVVIDKINNVPEKYRKIDEIIPFANNAGEKKEFKVTRINKENIELDGNHYLAGKTLLYKIKILDVRDSTDYDREQAKYP